ncbi:hypothetical protein KFL_003740070 [Klebsormidium nitens]|uniref:Uncharacterized protein n=1 Tax=Klebsormidium nitens TaxID=105231 RepID=A0A1Y1IG58_KLENI|nr:hypothetical protein KFL_003740070 [Klebsormidium nitens]|eukprot:GAQ87746.1 hypothetical protein KFL_003740070 [Klebsormidium nitens]
MEGLGVRPRLEPPPGLIQFDAVPFLLSLVQILVDDDSDGDSDDDDNDSQQLLRDSLAIQRVKALVNEQRKRLSAATNLVTWVQELGGLADAVKGLKGVYEKAVNEALQESVIETAGLARRTTRTFQIPADVSSLFLPDDYLTLRRVTHALAFVSLSARLLIPLKNSAECIQNAASDPPACHQHVIALLDTIRAMGDPLAARIRRKLPEDLWRNDGMLCYLWTGEMYEQNVEDAAHDLRNTLEMMLESVKELDDPVATSREAVDWDTLAATGAFPGVDGTPPPMTLEGRMERMKIIRSEHSAVVPILLYTDRKREKPDGSPVLEEKTPNLLPQCNEYGGPGVRYGVAFVSIPTEEALESDFDAMHVTEVWRLEKQQFLELYVGWSDSTDDRGVIFCPGFALDSAEQLFLAARLMSGIRSSGPCVVIGWRSLGALGYGPWISDREQVQGPRLELRDLVRDIFRFAPTAKPANIIAHGLGAAYITYSLLALPDQAIAQIGTIVVAASEEKAGSLREYLYQMDHMQSWGGRNGDPPSVRCLRYVQTHNRPFAFEKLVLPDSPPRDGESLEVCCEKYVTVSFGSEDGGATNHNLIGRNRRVLADIGQALRDPGEEWRAGQAGPGHQNLYLLGE